MPTYPYIGFPNFYRRAYNPNLYNNANRNNSSLDSSVSTNNDISVEKYNGNRKHDRNYNKKSPDNSCIFELFGLKLYFDDILLVCLLFFLYNEGVKDEGLFIALILLLLS